MQEPIKRKRGRPRKSESAAAPAVPLELTHFDELPGSAHVRLPVVMGLYGCSASAVWRNVKLGCIPAPRKLSANISAWNVADLRAALALKGAA